MENKIGIGVYNGFHSVVSPLPKFFYRKNSLLQGWGFYVKGKDCNRIMASSSVA